MKKNIVFNGLISGLGNGGGTKTIIRSAETLQQLGYSVHIAAAVNRYTWHKPKVSICCDMPHCDALICISAWDAQHTIDIRHENVYWWLRAWPLWFCNEDQLIKKICEFVSKGGKMLVNATHLKDKLKVKCGVYSKVCFAGLDFDKYYQQRTRDFKNPVVGVLVHNRHKTKRSDIAFDLMKDTKFHVMALCNDAGYDYDAMRNYYNNIDVFVSLSESEGFHNVPAEAGLCGCGVIYNDVPSGGCLDYCDVDTGIAYNSYKEMLESLGKCTTEKAANMKSRLLELGDRSYNMKRFAKVVGL